MFRRIMLILPMALIVPSGMDLKADSWSVKLGFPSDARVVILNARETGITCESNLASQELAGDGNLKSISIVVTGPWSNAMSQWCRRQSDLDVGISIALTNPYSSLHWRLESSEQGATTLVDANGLPWKNVAQLAVSCTADDVRRELDAQILRAQRLGIRPTHICGYRGTIFCRTDLAAVLLGASRKYWLPAPVVDLTPEMIERFTRQGFPLDQDMVELVQSYPFPKLDDIRSVPSADTYENKRTAFLAQLGMLPPGLFQFIFRPANESEGLKVLSNDWQQRLWDKQLLSDETVKKAIQDHRVVLTDWREIMDRFEGTGEISLETEPATSTE